jgi:hypothetical protein
MNLLRVVNDVRIFDWLRARTIKQRANAQPDAAITRGLWNDDVVRRAQSSTS